MSRFLLDTDVISMLSPSRTDASPRFLDWLECMDGEGRIKILGLDAEAAALSGRLEAEALSHGADPGMADAMIAGIAQAHALTIVSRNAKHFRPLGVKVIMPEET